jgi:hypothetical protein
MKGRRKERLESKLVQADPFLDSPNYLIYKDALNNTRETIIQEIFLKARRDQAHAALSRRPIFHHLKPEEG